MSIIELLIRLLMMLFMWFTVGTSATVPQRPQEAPMPPVQSAQPFQSEVYVTDVQVIVMESFPMQVQLQVAGEFPSGCDFPAQVEQRREGNTVTVRIYQEVPPDVLCPMILRPYNDTISLEGSFGPGDYVFRVNEYVVEQTL